MAEGVIELATPQHSTPQLFKAGPGLARYQAELAELRKFWEFLEPGEKWNRTPQASQTTNPEHKTPKMEPHPSSEPDTEPRIQTPKMEPKNGTKNGTLPGEVPQAPAADRAGKRGAAEVEPAGREPAEGRAGKSARFQNSEPGNGTKNGTGKLANKNGTGPLGASSIEPEDTKDPHPWVGAPPGAPSACPPATEFPGLGQDEDLTVERDTYLNNVVFHIKPIGDWRGPAHAILRGMKLERVWSPDQSPPVYAGGTQWSHATSWGWVFRLFVREFNQELRITVTGGKHNLTARFALPTKILGPQNPAAERGYNQTVEGLKE